MSNDQTREDIEALRRTAQRLRSERNLGPALELERVIAERESALTT